MQYYNELRTCVYMFCPALSIIVSVPVLADYFDSAGCHVYIIYIVGLLINFVMNNYYTLNSHRPSDTNTVLY